MSIVYEVNEIDGLYADAVVSDKNNEICFLSVWGLDTAIQVFLGRLSLPLYKGGLLKITLASLESPQVKNWHAIGNPELLQKQTGRNLSRQSLFQGLVHLWIYRTSVRQIDYVNRQCILLKQHSENAERFAARLWEAVKVVCPVPLLDLWKMIMDDFKAQGWIRHYVGIQVDAYALDFSAQDVEERISDWIKQGKLTLSQHHQKPQLSLIKK